MIVQLKRPRIRSKIALTGRRLWEITIPPPTYPGINTFKYALTWDHAIIVLAQYYTTKSPETTP